MTGKLKRTILGAVIAIALAAAVSYGLISQQTANNLQTKANQAIAEDQGSSAPAVQSGFAEPRPGGAPAMIRVDATGTGAGRVSVGPVDDLDAHLPGLSIGADGGRPSVLIQVIVNIRLFRVVQKGFVVVFVAADGSHSRRKAAA